MRKSNFHKNYGYSLVELVIVLAVIAILAAMALVSVRIIHSARAKDVAIEFDSMISETIQKSKNMDPNEGTYDGYAIAIYKYNPDDIFVIAPVYHNKNSVTGSGYYSPIYANKHGGYKAFEDTSANGCKDKILKVPSSVSMTFKGTTLANVNPESVSTTYKSADTEPKSAGNEWVYIRFDKKGNCISGYGEYKFYKKNGNVVSRVIIRRNGSHEVR